MKIFAFVFARGGSKGLPGKNIRNFVGKPLLAYPIELAQNISVIKKIFVSTDDETISDVATQWGADVIERPIHLAQDNSPEWLAWKHAIEWVEKNSGPFDLFVSLPATAPLRNEEDVKKCISKMDSHTDIVVTKTIASRSPWFNMVKEDENDYVQLLADDGRRFSRRQDTPKVYDLTTVAYVANPEYIKMSDHMFQGRVRAVDVPNERAVDIDTLFDFQIAEFLYQRINKPSVEKGSFNYAEE